MPHTATWDLYANCRITWFYIAMSDTRIMEKLEGIGDITCNLRCFLLGETCLLLDMVEQWTSPHFLKDHVEISVVFEPLENQTQMIYYPQLNHYLDQLHDVCMVLAHFEDLHFTKKTWSGMPGLMLVDHLHRKFFTRFKVLGGTNACYKDKHYALVTIEQF